MLGSIPGMNENTVFCFSSLLYHSYQQFFKKQTNKRAFYYISFFSMYNVWGG